MARALRNTTVCRLHRSCQATAQSSILHKRIVDETVEPTLSRLGGGDDGMMLRAGVFAGVSIRRRIAAERGAAGLARPQMHPRGADFHALFTFAFPRMFDVGHGAKVWASSCHFLAA